MVQPDIKKEKKSLYEFVFESLSEFSSFIKLAEILFFVNLIVISSIAYVIQPDFETRIVLLPGWASPHAYSVILFSILFLVLVRFYGNKYALIVFFLCDGIYETLGQLNIVQYYFFQWIGQHPVYQIQYDYQHILIETLILVVSLYLFIRFRLEYNIAGLIPLFAYSLMIMANAWISEFLNHSFTIPEFYFELLFICIILMVFLPKRIIPK